MAIMTKMTIWNHLIIDLKRLLFLRIAATDPEQKTSSVNIKKEVPINKRPRTKNWMVNDRFVLNKKAGKKAIKKKETFGLIIFITNPLLNNLKKVVPLSDCLLMSNSCFEL